MDSCKWCSGTCTLCSFRQRRESWNLSRHGLGIGRQRSSHDPNTGSEGSPNDVFQLTAVHNHIGLILLGV